MNIKVKDCRTCPMRQEDATLSDRDFSYLCNMEKKVLLQLAPESVQSEQTFLPEECPLKKNNFEIRLIGSEPTVINQVPIKEKKPRKPRVKKDGTDKPGIS